MDNKKETFGEVFVQFIKFGLVGVSNTIVSWVIFFLFNTFITPGVWFVANTTSWFLSVIWAYFMQNIFVFKEDESKEKRVWWKTLLKTYVSYAFTGLFLNNVLLWLWTTIDISIYFNWLFAIFRFMKLSVLADYFSISSNLGWVLNMVISIPLNFIINKFWSYRQKNLQGE